MTQIFLLMEPIDRMRKIYRISIYTCALIAEVMIAISPVPLSDIQLHIINEEIYLFSWVNHHDRFHSNGTKQKF